MQVQQPLWLLHPPTNVFLGSSSPSSQDNPQNLLSQAWKSQLQGSIPEHASLLPPFLGLLLRHSVPDPGTITLHPLPTVSCERSNYTCKHFKNGFKPLHIPMTMARAEATDNRKRFKKKNKPAAMLRLTHSHGKLFPSLFQRYLKKKKNSNQTQFSSV